MILLILQKLPRMSPVWFFSFFSSLRVLPLQDYERFVSRSQDMELQLSSKEKELEQLFQKQRRVRRRSRNHAAKRPWNRISLKKKKKKKGASISSLAPLFLSNRLPVPSWSSSARRSTASSTSPRWRTSSWSRPTTSCWASWSRPARSCCWPRSSWACCRSSRHGCTRTRRCECQPSRSASRPQRQSVMVDDQTRVCCPACTLKSCFNGTADS